MNQNTRFDERLADYNLSDADSKKTYNEKLFSAVAPKYDVITRVLSFGRDGAWKRSLVRQLPARDPGRILDLAAGTGDITFALAEKYANSRVIGQDLNPDMVELANSACVHRNVEFEVGDMCAIDQPDESFDIITGGYALRNAPDLTIALQEIRRLLRPGGCAGFLDFRKSPNRASAWVHLRLLKLWGSIWGYWFHRNPEVYGYIAESLALYPSSRELAGQLGELGFTDIRIQPLLLGFMELVFFRK